MRLRTGTRRRLEPMYLIIGGFRRSRRTTLRWAVMAPGDHPEEARMGADSHWVRWHAPYENPASMLSLRLATVQSMVRAALDEIPSTHPGPIRMVSLCAGQGR